MLEKQPAKWPKINTNEDNTKPKPITSTNNKQVDKEESNLTQIRKKQFL